MISDALMSAMEELVYEDSNEKNKNNSLAQDANEVLDKAKELAETLGRNVKVEELCSFGDFEEEFVRNVLEITGGIEIIEDLRISAAGKVHIEDPADNRRGNRIQLIMMP